VTGTIVWMTADSMIAALDLPWAAQKPSRFFDERQWLNSRSSLLQRLGT
jgi:hypothetical protein